MEKLRVYFGCALKGAPPDFIERFLAFKDHFRKTTWIEILDFCPPPPGGNQSTLSPREIYKNDIIDGVSTAHAIVMDISYPTSGGGFECGFGTKGLLLPTYLTSAKDGQPSSLLIGAADYEDHIVMDWYQLDIDELYETVLLWLKNVYEKVDFNEVLET